MKPNYNILWTILSLKIDNVLYLYILLGDIKLQKGIVNKFLDKFGSYYIFLIQV